MLKLFIWPIIVGEFSVGHPYFIFAFAESKEDAINEINKKMEESNINSKTWREYVLELISKIEPNVKESKCAYIVDEWA